MTPAKQTQAAQDPAVVLAAKAVGQEEAMSTAIVSTAANLEIQTAEELGASTDLLHAITGRQKALTEMRLAITRPMDLAKKQVLALFQPAVDQLAAAERMVKAAVLTYTQEQARLQREEQARLDAVAEGERLRLQRLAVRQRAACRDDRAEATEERAAIVQTPTAAPVEAPTGAHVVVRWHAEVTSLKALVRAVADGTQPITLLEPNMATLNMMAVHDKGDLAIPGVKAVAKEGVTVR